MTGSFKQIDIKYWTNFEISENRNFCQILLEIGSFLHQNFTKCSIFADYSYFLNLSDNLQSSYTELRQKNIFSNVPLKPSIKKGLKLILALIIKNSPGWTRTNNLPVNSRLLRHWATEDYCFLLLNFVSRSIAELAPISYRSPCSLGSYWVFPYPFRGTFLV